MSTFSLKRFSNPQILKSIQEHNLVALFRPYADYFRERGVEVVSYDGKGIDYDGLARVLITPDAHTPLDLVNDLYFVDEMSTPALMDELLEAIDELPKKDRPTLEFVEEPTPADVAVQVRLKAPDLIERKHAERKLTSRRAFEYFQSDVGADREFRTPSKKVLVALEGALDDQLVHMKRGRGCRVFVFEKEDGVWFLIRRGDPLKREGVMTDDGTSIVLFRPECYDLLKYDQDLGDLCMNADGKKLKTLYREKIGLHLFGNAQQFPATGKYTLEPLRTDGESCLVCSDIDGLEWIKFKEIQVYWGGPEKEVEVRKATDLFSVMKRRSRSLPAKARFLRAGFIAKFEDAKQPRTVTIAPPNVASYGRDADAVLVERWMQKRGFSLSVAAPKGAPDDSKRQSAVAHS